MQTVDKFFCFPERFCISNRGDLFGEQGFVEVPSKDLSRPGFVLRKNWAII